MEQRHNRKNQGGHFSWSSAKFLNTYKPSKSAAEFWGGNLITISVAVSFYYFSIYVDDIDCSS